MPFVNVKKKSFHEVFAYLYGGCPAKGISKFEGKYPTFSFNKNYQKYTNLLP